MTNRDIKQKVTVVGRAKVTQEVVASDRSSPLLPPFDPEIDHEAEGLPSQASLLETLRVSARRVELTGRSEIMSLARSWLKERSPVSQEMDHRVAVVHGPGGAGKTRLAAEILRQAEEWDWTAGFLPGNRDAEPDWPTLSHPEENTAIAIDYAESRHLDLKKLFDRAPVGRDAKGALRLILIVRADRAPTESWFDRLSGMWQLGSRAPYLLVDDLLTISLKKSLPSVEHRRELWGHAADALGMAGKSPPAYLTSTLFESPLYVLLDAYNEFTGDKKGTAADGADPPSAATLIDGVLRHEREYWTHARSNMELSLDDSQMNEVATTATLLNGVTEDVFGDALRAFSWLQEDDSLHRKVISWWSSVYASDGDVIRGVEPDPVGEHLVVRALEPKRNASDPLGGLLHPQQLQALISAAGVAGRQRMLRVLTRITSDGGVNAAPAKTTLGEILANHLDEFLPETFTGDVESLESEDAGEALASTLASAILACSAFALLEAKSTSGKGDAKQADASVKETALRIVSRHIERVAAREYEAGEWSSERYAEIAAWSLRHALDQSNSPEDLRFASFVREQRKLESLAPRPRRALADLYMHAGRHLERHRHYDEAESAYRRALEELEALGEGESSASYVIWHDLGDVATAREEAPEVAIERYERSLKGKEATDAGSVSISETLLALCVEQARLDFEKSFQRLSDGIAEIEAVGTDDKEADLSELPARFFIRLGRRKEAEAVYEEAEALYERGLAQLSDRGAADSPLAYVIWHDLGDVAKAKGEAPEVAIERYEKALEGKEKLLGDTHSSTIFTLAALAKALAGVNLDLGLERLAAAKGALDAVRDLSAIEFISHVQMEILADTRRFDEAAAIARDRQKRQGLARLRSAIFEAVADPLSLSDPYSVGPAIEMALLAKRIFAGGDQRLTSLTANLDELYALLTGELVVSHMDSRTADYVGEKIDEETKNQASDHDVLRLLREVVPNYRDLVSETQKQVVSLIEQSIKDPTISAIHRRQSPDDLSLADDITLRTWLARTLVAAGAGPQFDEEATLLLTFYVGVRLGILEAPFNSDAFIRIWQHADAIELAEAELERIAHDCEAVGDDSIDREALAEALDRQIVMTLRSIGERAAQMGRETEAESLLRRAHSVLERSGQAESDTAYAIWQSLGELSLRASNDPAAAIELFERALDGRTRLGGPTTEDAVASLFSLCEALAAVDLQDGLDRADRGVVDLQSSNADAEVLSAAKRLRPTLVFDRARAAEANGFLGEAEGLYLRALEELEALGEGDSRSSYVIWHDLGDVAVAKEEAPEVAIERYERSLEGKKATETDLASAGETLLALCIEEAELDLDKALERLAEGSEELEGLASGRGEVVDLATLPARLYFGMARRAEGLGRYEDTEALYSRALGELEGLGEGDSQLAYVILHDLGDVAMAKDEPPELAAGFYERSLEGKRRVLGMADPDTVTTLLGLCRVLAMEDEDAARERAIEAIDELHRLGASEFQVARIKDWLRTSESGS